MGRDDRLISISSYAAEISRLFQLILSQNTIESVEISQLFLQRNKLAQM